MDLPLTEATVASMRVSAGMVLRLGIGFLHLFKSLDLSISLHPALQPATSPSGIGVGHLGEQGYGADRDGLVVRGIRAQGGPPTTSPEFSERG